MTSNDPRSDLEGRHGRPLVRLVMVAWLSPVLAVVWSLARALGPGHWKKKLILMSVLGNLLFIGVLVIGYVVSKTALEAEKLDHAIVAPECVQRAQNPLQFCEAIAESELARIVPNAIYVACNGRHVARFEFVDEELTTLRDVTISDAAGRPWIDADLKDRTLIFSLYSDPSASEPETSLRDNDGDGIPDLMVKWRQNASFERDTDISWRRLSEN